MMRAALVSLSLLASSCGVLDDDDRESGSFGSYDEYVRARQGAQADLDRLVGDAEASGLAACRTVAVGEKACGGPVSYVVYSSEATDATAIVQVAEEITRMDAQANRQFGLASTCDVTPEPTVVWTNGICRAE